LAHVEYEIVRTCKGGRSRREEGRAKNAKEGLRTNTKVQGPSSRLCQGACCPREKRIERVYFRRRGIRRIRAILAIRARCGWSSEDTAAVQGFGRHAPRLRRAGQRRTKAQISNLKLHCYIVTSLQGRGCAMSEGISNLKFQISNKMTNEGNHNDEGEKVARSIFAKATVERRARRGKECSAGRRTRRPGRARSPGRAGQIGPVWLGLARFVRFSSVYRKHFFYPTPNDYLGELI
jgi:hypothetical protein